VSKFFCPLPWIHQFIQADGIKMCCSSQRKLNLTPAEFASSKYITSVKDQITNGVVPYDCQQCVNLEKQGYPSTRTTAITDWDYTVDTVPDNVISLDLRYSNLCNFSCRTCTPTFSSSIAKEIVDNPQTTRFYKRVDTIHLTNKNADVNKLLPNIKCINFTGGEPLLIKENIHILEQLIALGNIDCEILITTNGSVINPTIMNLINQFNSVHWTISLDGVGATAEYIRNGSIWNTIDQNIHTILSSGRSVALNTVLSAYSVLDISQLVKYFITLKKQYADQPLELWFALCEYPVFLNPIKILRSQQALDELAKAIDLLAPISSNPSQAINTLKSLHNDLKDVTIKNYEYNDEFINYTNELDNIRQQSFKQTFGIDINET
jgi:organic radical activating enzyme